MSLYPRFRDVHLYVGLAILIPVGVISATGIALNHEHALGLKPDHGRQKTPSSGAPPEFTATTAMLQHYGDGLQAALAAAAERWGRPQPLERVELKFEPGLGMVVKVKARREARAEPEELIWSLTEHRLAPHPDDDPRTAGFGGIHWNKVVKDLHTGKFFSKSYGYWWSDVSAASILVLSLTGIVLYAIPLMKKAGKKRRAAAPAAARAPGPPFRKPPALESQP